MWSATNTKIVAKAIATVESNMDYGATNPSDAITIGIAQWYGVRAANLLFTIKSDEPALFDMYCPTTIAAHMLLHSASDSWWNSRHLTKEERTQFRKLLTKGAVKAIQNAQLFEDIEGYLSVATRWGLNRDSETRATAFFCTVYHQSPRAASQIAASLPNSATLTNIYRSTLNNAIVGPYKSRQNVAHEIIVSDDYSGIDSPIDDPDGDAPDDGGDGDGSGMGTRLRGSEAHIIEQGNLLILTRKDGTTRTFAKSGAVYLPIGSGTGTDYDVGDSPDTPIDPNIPQGTGGDIVTFARTKLGDFSYSQAAGRMRPEVSGYTDCSAFIIYAFQKGGNVALNATYTGNLCTKGRLVANGKPSESELEVGDLIFLRWSGAVRGNSPFDHVELYCGGGRMISMGRTPGPTESAWDSDIDYALSRGGRVQIRRYL